MRVVKTFHVLQHFAPFESKTDNNISPLRGFCPIFVKAPLPNRLACATPPPSFLLFPAPQNRLPHAYARLYIQ